MPRTVGPRNSGGGILLELPGGQNPFSPTQIQLLVVGRDENEVLCGTLAGLMLRFLESRSIYLFSKTPSIDELDSRLGCVVQALLTKRVWRYYDGLSGEQGYYRIDPDFADLCYRIDEQSVAVLGRVTGIHRSNML